jgi:steroid 5-alpha reductase family enzyme
MTLSELLQIELIILLVVSLVLTGLHFIASAIKNASIVDVFWAASFGLIAIFATIFLPGLPERDVLLIAAVAPWSTRLAVHLGLRVSRDHPHEDARYAALRKQWGERSSLAMYLVFLFQGALITLLAVPFVLIAADSAPLHLNEWLGLGICLLGTAGEAIADHQLSAFKADPNNKGKVCSSGLWNYSRHPNYFFEFVVWIGIGTIAASAPLGLLALYCPLVMFFVLTQMTGVKISERQSLQSRGDLYRQYQESTSSFVPWFKKRRSI